MRAVVSISVPAELAEELNRLSRETGRNKSEMIREALRAFFWEERYRKTARAVGIKSKKRGIVTDEDVFQAVS